MNELSPEHAANDEALRFAWNGGEHWNRLYVAKLNALGFRLAPVTDPRPPSTIDAPRPVPEGWQYLYPSMIVPIENG